MIFYSLKLIKRHRSAIFPYYFLIIFIGMILISPLLISQELQTSIVQRALDQDSDFVFELSYQNTSSLPEIEFSLKNSSNFTNVRAYFLMQGYIGNEQIFVIVLNDAFWREYIGEDQPRFTEQADLILLTVGDKEQTIDKLSSIEFPYSLVYERIFSTDNEYSYNYLKDDPSAILFSQSRFLHLFNNTNVLFDAHFSVEAVSLPHSIDGAILSAELLEAELKKDTPYIPFNNLLRKRLASANSNLERLRPLISLGIPFIILPLLLLIIEISSITREALAPERVKLKKRGGDDEIWNQVLRIVFVYIPQIFVFIIIGLIWLGVEQSGDTEILPFVLFLPLIYLTVMVAVLYKSISNPFTRKRYVYYLITSAIFSSMALVKSGSIATSFIAEIGLILFIPWLLLQLLTYVPYPTGISIPSLTIRSLFHSGMKHFHVLILTLIVISSAISAGDVVYATLVPSTTASDVEPNMVATQLTGQPLNSEVLSSIGQFNIIQYDILNSTPYAKGTVKLIRVLIDAKKYFDMFKISSTTLGINKEVVISKIEQGAIFVSPAFSSEIGSSIEVKKLDGTILNYNVAGTFSRLPGIDELIAKSNNPNNAEIYYFISSIRKARGMHEGYLIHSTLLDPLEAKQKIQQAIPMAAISILSGYSIYQANVLLTVSKNLYYSVFIISMIFLFTNLNVWYGRGTTLLRKALRNRGGQNKRVKIEIYAIQFAFNLLFIGMIAGILVLRIQFVRYPSAIPELPSVFILIGLILGILISQLFKE